MENLLQRNPSYAPFARMLAIALLHGWLFSMVMLFLTVQVRAIATNAEFPAVMATLTPIAWIVIAVAAILVGFAFMAPLATLFAWPAYRRGVKSHAVYIAFGSLVGFLTFLALTGFKLEGGREDLLAFEWFVASGAFGGWSFAHRLNRQSAGRSHADS